MFKKITIFFACLMIFTSLLWYSDVEIGSDLNSSVLSVQDVSCTDVPAKIQESIMELGMIQRQIEQLKTDLIGLNNRKAELSISAQQIESEKNRIADFEHNFFKEKNFSNVEELRLYIQKIGLNLIDLKEKLSSKPNILDSLVLRRKIRILENKQKKNSALLAQYMNTLEIEKVNIQNLQTRHDINYNLTLQQIIEKESSIKNYESSVQQLQSSQDQLSIKAIACTQSASGETAKTGSEIQNASSGNTNTSLIQAETEEEKIAINTATENSGMVASTQPSPNSNESVNNITTAIDNSTTSTTEINTGISTATDSISKIGTNSISIEAAEQNTVTNVQNSSITQPNGIENILAPGNVVTHSVAVSSDNKQTGESGSIFQDNAPIYYKNELDASCPGFLKNYTPAFEISSPQYNQYINPTQKLHIKGRCLDQVIIRALNTTAKCINGQFDLEADFPSWYYSGVTAPKLHEIYIDSLYEYKDKEGNLQNTNTLTFIYLPLIINPENKELENGKNISYVHTPQEFNDFLRDNVSGTMVLDADLDFSGVDIISRINFSGVINGNGKTIRNIKTPGTSLLNVFSGKIINLNIENISSENKDQNGDGIGFGLIAARCNGAYFDNVKVKNAYLKLGIYAGAFCNTANYTVIKNSSVSQSTISGVSGFAGGFIGFAQQKVLLINLKFSGQVVGFNYVGGIGGMMKDTCMINNESAGDIVGSQLIGSLVGQINFQSSDLKHNFFEYKDIGEGAIPIPPVDRSPYEFASRIISSKGSGKVISNMSSGGFAGSILGTYVGNSSFSGTIEPLIDYDKYGLTSTFDLNFGCQIGGFSSLIGNSLIENSEVNNVSFTGNGNLGGFAYYVVNGRLNNVHVNGGSITAIPYSGRWGTCPVRLAGFVNVIGANWDSLERLNVDFVNPATSSIKNWSTNIQLLSQVPQPYTLSPFTNEYNPFKNSNFKDAHDTIIPSY